MIITNRKQGYSSRRKYVHGKGFVDSLTSTLKSVGSYVSQNKDLIAKPLLGAVGNLTAAGLEEGTKLLMNHIINKNTQRNTKNNTNPMVNQHTSQLDDKALAILENLMNGEQQRESQTNVPVGNIYGSGIKKIL
jgi:hypothetical protein